MYTRTQKNDFRAKWICASDDYLQQFDRPHIPTFPTAQFIWGVGYTRQHFRRTVTVMDEVKTAFLHFRCDNGFDVFLNGILLSDFRKDTGVIDLKPHLHRGENLLWLRTYQTANAESFTSALIGGIRIVYENGKTEDYPTDISYKTVRLVTFWETEEPQNWLSDNTGGRVSDPVVTNLHAIAVKRSCYFRKTFQIAKPVSNAILYGSARGCYEPHLNGHRIDDAQFMPSATDNVKEYQTFDVTNQLIHGENVLAAMTGNGWFNCSSWGQLFARKPSLMMELHITYTDGTSEIIATDETWKVKASPLTDNDLQFGERYDARLEIPDWNHTASDCDWNTAEALDPNPHPVLIEQNYPPVRPANVHKTAFLREIGDGVRLYDCGINIAGTFRITLRNLKKGQQVRIFCCERLTKDGLPELGAYGAVFYQQDSLPNGKAPYNLRNLNVYTAKGDATEIYQPRYTYTGFRYLYVEGADDYEIEGIELHNDLNTTGTFETSDPALTQIWNAVTQTWKNNCYNGPTDCPTREKNFWNGDMQIFSHAACWYQDVSTMLARWTDIGRKLERGVYGWEDEEYVLPWVLYRFYGDKEILRVKYPVILELIKKRTTHPNMLLPEDPGTPSYRDWLNPTGQNISPDFFAACWYLRMLDITSQIAKVLDDTATRQDLTDRFEKGKDLFNKRYLNRETGLYESGIQSAQVLPLAFDLVPDEFKQKTADALNRTVEKNGYKLTTGFHATRYLLDVLTDYGHGETAVKLLHQTEFPSWLFVLHTGATNMTESWMGMWDEDKSLSMSHFSLGACIAWFFEYLGGIRIMESEAGLSHIVLHPYGFPQIGPCKITYRTKYGTIVSEWYEQNGTLQHRYAVPEGITVTYQR